MQSMGEELKRKDQEIRDVEEALEKSQGLLRKTREEYGTLLERKGPGGGGDASGLVKFDPVRLWETGRQGGSLVGLNGGPSIEIGGSSSFQSKYLKKLESVIFQAHNGDAEEWKKYRQHLDKIQELIGTLTQRRLSSGQTAQEGEVFREALTATRQQILETIVCSSFCCCFYFRSPHTVKPIAEISEPLRQNSGNGIDEGEGLVSFSCPTPGAHLFLYLL